MARNPDPQRILEKPRVRTGCGKPATDRRRRKILPAWTIAKVKVRKMARNPLPHRCLRNAGLGLGYCLGLGLRGG